MLTLTAPSSWAGTLIGSAVKLNDGANVNLTAAGALDWVHWGLQSDTSINRKANVAPQISDMTPVRAGNETNSGVYIFQFSDNLNSYSWSDGTPTPAVNETTTGVWAYGWPPPGVGSGFEITAPADTSLKTLKVYVGAYAARGRFEATLSDGSAPAYLSNDDVVNFRGGPNTVFTLQFAANSAGQILRIRYTAGLVTDPAGNVTLLAAALTAEGANNPPSVSLTSPTSNTNIAESGSVTFSATAADLDGQVERVEFYAGGQKLDESTNGNPFTFVWDNPVRGYHLLTAVAYDNSGNFAESAPVEIFVHGSDGLLVGSGVLPPAQVNLTTEGTLDWTHWGTVSSNSFDRKANVAERISNFNRIGSDPVQRYSNNYTSFSWSDGTPNATEFGSQTGVFITGYQNGYRLTIPADGLPKRVKVYVGLYGAVGNFQAYLSDMSAPAYTDTTLKNEFGDSYRVYTLDFRAANAGEHLIIQYRSKELYDFDYGNVTLQSASLSGEADTNLVPQVQVMSPTNNSVFFIGSDILIEANAIDPDGSVVRVEFFQNNVSLGQDTTEPYTVLWTNPSAGSYTLTAKVTDNLNAIVTSSPIKVDVRAQPEVRLLRPRLEAGELKFDISTLSGRTYTIQRSAILTPGDWQEWSSFTGDGTTRTLTDATGPAPHFYRALVQ